MPPNRDKAALYQPFALLLDQFEQALQRERLPFYLFMGLRTYEEQNALYEQGRSLPGNIVTNARGGQSWHNFGLAADYVRDGDIAKPGLQWSWSPGDDWHRMGIVAEECGLEWGGRWTRFPDKPHVQKTFGLTLQLAQALYEQGGLAVVWDAIV